MSEQRKQWLLFAISSGACAALNGVFAKLTTTQLTTSWSAAISRSFGLDETDFRFELLVRGLFLALNIAFNGVMWALFTRALTLASSTLRVGVINTSSNFIVTAVLSAIIFREQLPALWWLGAAFLVIGSVIIGRRDERKDINEKGRSDKDLSVPATDATNTGASSAIVDGESPSTKLRSRTAR